MQKDPILEEIRKIRGAHAAKFNFEFKDISADLKKKKNNLEILKSHFAISSWGGAK
jgi:hypothetical protein